MTISADYWFPILVARGEATRLSGAYPDESEVHIIRGDLGYFASVFRASPARTRLRLKAMGAKPIGGGRWEVRKP